MAEESGGLMSVLEGKAKLVMVLKILGVIGPAIGSWYTAREQSQNETEKAYSALADAVKELQSSAKVLEQNQERIWQLTITGHRPVAEPTAAPRGEGIGLGSIGTIGHGAGTGSGFGSGAGRLGGSSRPARPRRAPTSAMDHPPEPESDADDEQPEPANMQLEQLKLPEMKELPEKLESL